MSLKKSEVRLSEGRWNKKNREELIKLIEENKNQGNYVVFDWDNTSIQGDTQKNLFNYQTKKLLYKIEPSEFERLIRKDIPIEKFSMVYKNLNGEILNIERLAKDLRARYDFLYENYILKEKKNFQEIILTEEYKDFVAKMHFLHNAVADSFSNKATCLWEFFLFTGFSQEELKIITKNSNDYALGDKLGKLYIESSDILTGESGKIRTEYENGLRIRPEIADLFCELRRNEIEVHIVSASMQEVIEVFATDSSYGYNLDIKNIHAMRVKNSGKSNKIIDEYEENYPLTQRVGKVTAINKYIRDRYDGKAPILVAGDAEGDENMLTEYKETQKILLMKREGKLDNLVNNGKTLLQYSDSSTGLLRPENFPNY